MRTRSLALVALFATACSALSTRAHPPAAVADSDVGERPGLGTTWGETRTSPVHEVPFERADPARPFAAATLYYDDASGVSAMSARDAPDPRRDAEVPIEGGLTVSVMSEFGLPLPARAVGGRLYVIGEHGLRYTLVVRNRTAARVEVVASVDGLDVIDGAPASMRKRGYLVDPFGTLVIDGFRKSREEVAAFRFGTVADSYAARTGSDREVGIIGIAFFDERGTPPRVADDVDLRRSARAFPLDARASND